MASKAKRRARSSMAVVAPVALVLGVAPSSVASGAKLMNVQDIGHVRQASKEASSSLKQAALLKVRK